MSRILIVDDDPTVVDVVRRYLEQDGHGVRTAADGAAGLAAFAAERPDLIVLDLMLPKIDGLDVCRRVRAESDVPIVMLTALGEESDRVLGLELGADDYVTKPFSPRELALRVSSILRRGSTAVEKASDQVSDGGLVLDPASRGASRDGERLGLTQREFDLLFFFMTHPQTAFGRDDLLERVWGWSFGDSSTVTVHVRRLREKIEQDPSDPKRIRTVWGVGYRYELAGSAVTEGM